MTDSGGHAEAHLCFAPRLILDSVEVDPPASLLRRRGFCGNKSIRLEKILF